MPRPAGHYVADQLVAQGVEVAFGVPGESFLAVLDGLWARRDRIRFVTARHEAAASHMAEAWGKLTGRPGVCLVTRGPGAAHAAVGVHTAMHDSTPMLLLVGQVERDRLGRDAFQEVDVEALFAPIAKWAHQVERAEDLPGALARAVETALAGRPGPVVLALPEDLQRDPLDAPDLAWIAAPAGAPAADAVERLHDRLAAAERPLIVVGGPHWDGETAAALAAWAQASRVPVTAQFRRQDRLDNDCPAYVGDLGLAANPALQRRLAEADLVVLLGGRFGDVPSGGFTRLSGGSAGRELVHVHADPAELGRLWAADLAIAATAPAVVAALAARGPAPNAERRRGWAEALRGDYVAWSAPLPRDLDGVDLARVVAELRAVFPDEAIVANGAGNYAIWLHRHFRYRRCGTQLAPTSGAMGYGLPAAIAAGLRHPDRDVIALAGDGCFQMASAELATAAELGLERLLVLVCDNGMLGTIRMHQERAYPGRVEGTVLVNPDFAQWARACGWHGERVETDAELAGALARARAVERPALLHLITDPRAITPAGLLD